MRAGDPVRMVFRKWGERPHWEYDARLLGSDVHGDWVGAPPGTQLARPGAEFVADSGFVTLVPRDEPFVATFYDPHHEGPADPVELYVDITTVPRWSGDGTDGTGDAVVTAVRAERQGLLSRLMVDDNVTPKGNATAVANVTQRGLQKLWKDRLKKKVVSAGGELSVVVETDAGVVGIGEGSQNDQDAAVAANVRQLAPRYIGHDPLERIEAGARLVTNNRAGRAIAVAVSAIEQALWDTAGKLLDVPVYQLLGGRWQDRLRCYATMGAGVDDRSADSLAQEAARCVGAGCGSWFWRPWRPSSSCVRSSTCWTPGFTATAGSPPTTSWPYSS